MARYDPLKRVIDVAAAAAALVITLPVQAAVALAVRLDLGSPVLFRQPRPGKNGRVFELAKFRTMRTGDADDVDRLTACGRFLRATSLDELPTFWHVLRGEMSLVGPRPLLVEYLDRYTPEQARRHEVRPGVTGLAQVSGRNNLDWDAKLALDVAYVDQRSLWLDLSILVRTIGVVLRRSGISSAGHATMPKFDGREDADAHS